MPIPPRTLAEFAYNHMLIPRPTLTLNPAARGYVNLGTYVWGNWAASPHDRADERVQNHRDARRADRDRMGAGERLRRERDRAGHPLLGRLRPGRVPLPAGPGAGQRGPGVAPDCGVLWRAPTTGAALTATVRWVITWGVGNLDGPGGTRCRRS